MIGNEEAVMAKRGRPKKLTGEGSQVRIAPDLASMARLIVGERGIDLAEYLNEIIRPRITRDYAAMIKRLEGGKGGEK